VSAFDAPPVPEQPTQVDRHMSGWMSMAGAWSGGREREGFDDRQSRAWCTHKELYPRIESAMYAPEK